MALSLVLIKMLTDYPYCNGVRKPISHWGVCSGKAASRLESESGDGCGSMKVVLWNKEDAIYTLLYYTGYHSEQIVSML